MYTAINDFGIGIDRRRPRFAAQPGSLWDAVNCHISRGGDIEKRKAFVPTFTLPAGSVGLSAASATLYAYGSGVQPAGWPAGITYQRLQKLALTLTEILDATVFNGLPYVVAKYNDGTVAHFYNGTEVTDWPGATRPTNVFTYQSKMYGLDGSLLRFSAVNDPTKWNTGTGFGFINIANNDAGGDALYGIETFQGQVVLFSRRSAQIWNIKVDPAQNVLSQTLKNTGTRVPRGVIAFGDIDVFYLDDTGVRSVKARNTANAGFVSDIGTPIDTYIRDFLRGQPSTVLTNGISAIEPTDGRYWLVLGSKVFVFSYFPSSKINGWTTYEPGFAISDLAVVNDKMYCRSGDTVYLYGGDNGDIYDASTVSIKLPYMSGGKVATNKQVVGADIGASGTWDVVALVDPRDETRKIQMGLLDGVTYQDLGTVGGAYTPFYALELTSSEAGLVSLSNMVLYYNGGEAN
jgi:hypothetical protein